MDFSKLAKGLMNSDVAKDVLSKTTKAVSSKSGFDLGSLVGLATKNADVVSLLGKIGALKGVNEPEESPVQKLVKQLYTLVGKSTGIKIDEEMFSKIINKILASEIIKKKIEKLAGNTAAITFIKKAISAFVG